MYRQLRQILSTAFAVTCLAGFAHGEGKPLPGMASSVKVAGVQILPDHSIGVVEQVVSYMERAAGDGARLIVFPEYHLGHIHIPGPETDRMTGVARELGINVVVGCFEVESEEVFYNAALLINEAGEIAGVYRKVHPAVGEPPHFWPARGDEWEARMTTGGSFPVFDLGLAKVGIFTCYDGYFPEVPNILSLQGAEILIWINGRAGAVEDFMVRTMTYQTYTAMIATNAAHGFGTMIAQFPATIHAYADAIETDYITATIDLDHLREYRANSRVFHQRRPDLYTPITMSWKPWERYNMMHEIPEVND